MQPLERLGLLLVVQGQCDQDLTRAWELARPKGAVNLGVVHHDPKDKCEAGSIHCHTGRDQKQACYVPLNERNEPIVLPSP